MASAHGVTPGARDRLARRAHEDGQRQVGWCGEIVRIGAHHGVGEAAGPKQGLDRLPQFLGCEDSGGAGVLEAMPQLLAAAHGVDRHHHCVGAQDRIVADHVLRAVLRIKQHPIAARDATVPLQKTREGIHLALELTVSRAAAVVVEGAVVGIATGAHLEVEVDARPRHRQGPRQSGRPVGVMPVEHASKDKKCSTICRVSCLPDLWVTDLDRSSHAAGNRLGHPVLRKPDDQSATPRDKSVPACPSTLRIGS